jgi:sulfide:quinone oxidoreductase
MNTHYSIVIIGGGTAGIMTASLLLRKLKRADIAILEPSDNHYYQAAWTLVGAGTFDFNETRRAESEVIPKGVNWIKEFAVKINPESNSVRLAGGGQVSYDFLVVCPGLVMDVEAMPGLKEALNTPFACSNYTDPEHTWEVIKKFKGGNAVFTQPSTPIKCGGAPQKIMYLAEEAFVKQGVRDKTKVIYASPGSVIFGVKEFAVTLNRVLDRKRVITRFFHSPVKIDPERRIIFFRYTRPNADVNEMKPDHETGQIVNNEGLIEMHYDLLHIAPPQKAPGFIEASGLAYIDGPSRGWMNVNIHTLQHNDYANIFGLGDVAALPTAKTGAAVRKQVPVVVDNIISLMKNNGGFREYNGYSSCPLVTGYGKMVLAEFKYDNVRDSDPLLSKFWDTSKEQYGMWLLKKYGLPYLYWNQMLKGRMMK